VEVLGQIIEEDKDLELVGKAHNGEEICISPATGPKATFFQKFLTVCNQSSWCKVGSWGE